MGAVCFSSLSVVRINDETVPVCDRTTKRRDRHTGRLADPLHGMTRHMPNPNELQIMHYRNLTAAVIAGLGLVTSGIASAQSTTSTSTTTTTDTWRMPYQSGFWGHAGASVGQSKLELGCPAGGSCDNKDTSFRVYAGGKFNNAFGLELGLVDYGTFDRAGGETKGRGLYIPLIFGYPLGTISSVFAKAGVN